MNDLLISDESRYTAKDMLRFRRSNMSLAEYEQHFKINNNSGVVTLGNILTVCCRFFNCSIRNAKSKCRKPNYVSARQHYFFYAVKLTRKSLGEIGAEVNRDHATVLHGVRKINGIIELTGVYVDPRYHDTERLTGIFNNIFNTNLNVVPAQTGDKRYVEIERNYGHSDLPR